MIFMVVRRVFSRDASSDWSFDELRRRCMEGSQKACKVFMDRFSPLVWRTVIAQMPGASRQDQEEVVASTFVRLLANRAELLGRYNRALGLSPESYIRRQAVFQAGNRRRHLHTIVRKAEVPFANPGADGDGPTEADHPDTRPNPEQALLEREQVDELIQALEARLPPEVLVTFHLLYENGLSPKEVAALLGCSTDMIYVRRKRIVAAVRDILKERHQGKRGGS